MALMWLFSSPHDVKDAMQSPQVQPEGQYLLQTNSTWANSQLGGFDQEEVFISLSHNESHLELFIFIFPKNDSYFFPFKDVKL